jgi:hypothetical protein
MNMRQVTEMVQCPNCDKQFSLTLEEDKWGFSHSPQIETTCPTCQQRLYVALEEPMDGVGGTRAVRWLHAKAMPSD